MLHLWQSATRISSEQVTWCIHYSIPRQTRDFVKDLLLHRTVISVSTLGYWVYFINDCVRVLCSLCDHLMCSRSLTGLRKVLVLVLKKIIFYISTKAVRDLKCYFSWGNTMTPAVTWIFDLSVKSNWGLNGSHSSNMPMQSYLIHEKISTNQQTTRKHDKLCGYDMWEILP